MYQTMHDALVAPARRGPGFATVPEPLPPEKPPTAGPAYFYTRDVGLVTFGVDGTVTLQKLAIERVGALAVTAAGTVIVGGTHVFEVDKEGVATQIGGDDSPAVEPLSGALEVAPDGKIWVANVSGVYSWDGAAWTKYEPGDIVGDFAFDGKGRVFTASNRRLGVIDGGTWKKMYDLEGTPHEGVVANPAFGSIAVIGKQLVATHSFGILELDGTNVVAIDRKIEAPTLRFGTVVGTDYLVVDHASLVRTPLAGGADTVVSIKSATSVGGRDVQFDARGRAWSTDGLSSLFVVATDGTTTSWPTATLPEISSTIEALYVVGTGPDTLPGKTAVAKGTIRGHITRAGTPLAKAYVEICRVPDYQIAKGATPCSGSGGKDDADETGAFSIADLPLQDYSIVIRDADKWYMLASTACGGMKDGETCDVGELDVANKLFPTAP
jgi:hypothetical protein